MGGGREGQSMGWDPHKKNGYGVHLLKWLYLIVRRRGGMVPSSVCLCSMVVSVEPARIGDIMRKAHIPEHKVRKAIIFIRAFLAPKLWCPNQAVDSRPI